MSPAEIIELWKRRSFTAPPIVLTDDKTRDVPHPQCMLVARRIVHLVIHPGADEVDEKDVDIDPIRIVRVRPRTSGNGTKPKRPNDRGRRE